MNDIMFANIQKRHKDMVNIDVVTKEFAERNERQVKYYIGVTLIVLKLLN